MLESSNTGILRIYENGKIKMVKALLGPSHIVIRDISQRYRNDNGKKRQKPNILFIKYY